MRPFTPVLPVSRLIRLGVIAAVVALVGMSLVVAGGPSRAFADGGTATVSGVVSGGGAVLAGASVSIQSEDGTYFDETQSGDDGAYSFAGIPAGDYTLSFVPADGTNFLPQWWQGVADEGSATYFTIADGQTLSAMNADLAVGATISGTVDAAGSPNTPLAGATVTVLDSHQGQVASAITDANGDYTIQAIPAGTFSLQFRAADGQNYGVQYWQNADSAATATPVTVASGQSLAGFDAALSAGASISGTAWAPGSPKVGLADVVVSVYAASGGGPVANVVTNARGHYSVSALAPGSYSVSFSPDHDANAALEWWGGSFIQTGAQTLALAAGEARTGISQHLVVGSIVSGTVLEAAASPTPPATFVDVTLWPSDQLVGSNDLPPFEVVTDASGNYSFSNVGPGTYTLQFGSEDPGFRSQWWRNKPSQAKATQLIVKLDKPRTGIDATLAAQVLVPDTPRISGHARVGQTLTAKTGAWKPNTVVFAYQWTRDGVAIDGATSDTYVPTVADVGHQLAVAVTGTIPQADTQGLTDTEVSAPTAAVRPAAAG